MQKLAGMASYTQFLGRIVTVQYRAGDMLLSAYGSFVGDSGRSIFLEQHVEQRGKRSYFRWEIPYQYIHRIVVDSLSEKTQAAAGGGRAGGTRRREQKGSACRRRPIRGRCHVRAFPPPALQDSLTDSAARRTGRNQLQSFPRADIKTGRLCARRRPVSTTTAQRRIGLIGLGLMGRPMGMNLLKAGPKLTVGIPQ